MNYLVGILMLLGAFFAFVAAVGVFRMPDLYMRMHAATKAGAFGASLMLVSAACYFGSWRAIVTAVLVIIFFYLTTPVAAQTIAGAAHKRGVKLWSKTVVDKLSDEKLER